MQLGLVGLGKTRFGLSARPWAHSRNIVGYRPPEVSGRGPLAEDSEFGGQTIRSPRLGTASES